MAETADQIIEHIEAQRDRLGTNINELEAYVREKTDVRQHYSKKPWTFLGGAAVAGLLFAVMIIPNGRKHPRYLH
jgi:ElaB/YqjD/DUF883 family membrane-anchored ribosome-binding protein